ncbi:GNAT family N-acetyltransferase [Streptomyces sp. NPDC093108]|uniref:GNAT family N-acetyltransferase n=1 Tax=Streptomyces sp. NPDC093108 TaxID=3366030 RepID=UPI0038286D52
MPWTISKNPVETDRWARKLWMSDPGVHTMLLSVMGRCLKTPPNNRPPQTAGWWSTEGGFVAGSFCFASGDSLLLGAMPVGAGRQLAVLLAEVGKSVASVQGPRSAVAEFTAQWEQLAGMSRTSEMQQKLHQLDRLIRPQYWPAGSGRSATAADRDLLVNWFRCFAEETGTASGDVGPAVDYRIASGGLFLWELDERPVALAGASVPAGGCVRITPVYTPQEGRKQGFGGAAVTVAVQHALSTGVDTVVLFTDATNPASNSLYEALGFSPTGESVQVIYS